MKSIFNVNKPKHYVVICDFAVEGVILNGLEIAGVAHSYEEATAILAKAVADERQYAKENGWVINQDTEDVFDAGESENYLCEHSCFYIKEV